MNYIKIIKNTVKNKNLSFDEKLKVISDIKEDSNVIFIEYYGYEVFSYKGKSIIIFISNIGSSIRIKNKIEFLNSYLSHINYHFDKKENLIRILNLVINKERLIIDIGFLKKTINKLNNHESIEIVLNNILNPHIFSLDLPNTNETLYILKFNKKHLIICVNHNIKMFKFLSISEFIHYKETIENYSNDMTNLYYALDDYYTENLKE